MNYNDFIDNIVIILNEVGDSKTLDYLEQHKEIHNLFCLSDLYCTKTKQFKNKAVKYDLWTGKEINKKSVKKTFTEKQMLNYLDKLYAINDNFEAIQNLCNEILEKKYKEDFARESRRYLDLNSFIRFHVEIIFTTKQLVDLYSRFEEITNPESRAKKFKEQCKISKITNKDFKIIKTLEKDIKLFYKDKE